LQPKFLPKRSIAFHRSDHFIFWDAKPLPEAGNVMRAIEQVWMGIAVARVLIIKSKFKMQVRHRPLYPCHLNRSMQHKR
jgi:hypothetical protein